MFYIRLVPIHWRLPNWTLYVLCNSFFIYYIGTIIYYFLTRVDPVRDYYEHTLAHKGIYSISTMIALLYSCMYVFLLFKAWRRSQDFTNKKRYAILLLGIVLQTLWIYSVLYIFDDIFPTEWNIQYMGIFLDLICIRIAIIRYDFLPAYEKRFKILFDSSPFGIFMVDYKGIIKESNLNGNKLLGFANNEANHTSIINYFIPERRDSYWAFHQSSFVNKRVERNQEGKLLVKSGEQLDIIFDCDFLEVEQEDLMVVIIRDITEQKSAEAQIYYLAYHDILTGLFNRSYFIDSLNKLSAEPIQTATPIYLMLLDLDHFKTINDTFGHPTGDLLLKKIAAVLSSYSEEHDIVTRLGGDEFVILFTSIQRREDLIVIVEHILKDSCISYCSNSKSIHITSSIGISVFPTDGTDPSLLLKKADIALYQSKAQGRNNYHFYISS